LPQKGAPLSSTASGVHRQIAAALALLLFAATAAAAAPLDTAPPAASDLAAVRQQGIAAAADVQRREQVAASLGHAIDLLGSDLAGRRRGLADTRTEQALLLGELERVALHPPDRFIALPQEPLDRARGELLRQAIVPALRTEAQALAAAFARIAALTQEIAARQKELSAARDALATARAHLANLAQRRLVLEHQLLPQNIGDAAPLARLGRDAKDVGDLIKRADAEEDRRDRELLARARKAARKSSLPLAAAAADPTRPTDLHSFDPPASRLTPPVAGSLRRAFGAADPADNAAAASSGLSFDATPGATVVAPFDGRVSYAAPFGTFGLILIIRHGGLYHSLLAGLGRVDVRIDDWVLAGEPVGAMPDKPGVGFYLELRREGRPVDPQPWLAARDAERGGHDGDQKVSE
jgi:septal ring factor EnvC (AmiA/AmiB activator)